MFLKDKFDNTKIYVKAISAVSHFSTRTSITITHELRKWVDNEGVITFGEIKDSVDMPHYEQLKTKYFTNIGIKKFLTRFYSIFPEKEEVVNKFIDNLNTFTNNSPKFEYVKVMFEQEGLEYKVINDLVFVDGNVKIETEIVYDIAAKEIWMWASNLCKNLGYVNPDKPIRLYITPKNKKRFTSLTVKNNRVYINQAGLQQLAVNSKYEIVRKFWKWICNDILPQFTKLYSSTNANDGLSENKKPQLHTSTDLSENENKTNDLLQNTNDQGNLLQSQTNEQNQEQSKIKTEKMNNGKRPIKIDEANNNVKRFKNGINNDSAFETGITNINIKNTDCTNMNNDASGSDTTTTTKKKKKKNNTTTDNDTTNTTSYILKEILLIKDNILKKHEIIAKEFELQDRELKLREKEFILREREFFLREQSMKQVAAQLQYENLMLRKKLQLE